MKVRGAYEKEHARHLPKTLGERVRRVRLSWKWTQGQLAKAVHSKQNAISKWENDSAQPTGAALGSLAALFRLTPEALVTGKGFTVTAPPIGDGEAQSRTPPLQVSLLLGPRLSRSERLAFLELEPALQAMSMARPA